MTDQSAVRESAPSILVAGRRSQSLGFPLTGLYSKQPELDALADRALARYARVMNRVESFEVDSRVDPRWLPQLATLDVGRGVEVQRDGLAAHPLKIEGVVVGFQHRLTPDHWTSTITVSTVTESI
jgi:hypothetical protein